jgi:4-amino-4-deoxy-L-arabinose transferase-like glycosyltransferase
MEGTERHGRLLALALVVLAAAWLVGLLSVTRNGPLTPDAAAYGIIARNLARGDGYTESFVPFHPGPYDSVRHLPDLHGLLTPVLLAPLFAAQGGASAAAVRVPGALAVPGIALVVFALARRLYGATPAFLAALLVLASPNLVLYAALGTDDTGFTLLATAMVALLVLAVHERRPRLLVSAGVLAGVAILAKPTGVFLPALGVVATLMLRRTTPVPIGAVLGLLAPPIMAFGVYVLRNLIAHGSPDFRFGGLEWIWKDSGFEGMMALYERPPSTLETVRRLGLARVVEITRKQFDVFMGATFRLRPVLAASLRELGTVAVPAFLPLLALLPLPWLWRRTPSLAAVVLVTFVTAPLVVCTLWHPEPRYFAVLIPLAALVLAGTIGRSLAGRAAMMALALASAFSAVAVARTFLPVPYHVCLPVLGELAAAGTAGPIMTLDPWGVAWLADRETVMTPSGDLDDIATVARRYGTRLMLIHPMLGRQRTVALLETLEGRSGPLHLTTLARRGACRLVRLDVLDDPQP